MKLNPKPLTAFPSQKNLTNGLPINEGTRTERPPDKSAIEASPLPSPPSRPAVANPDNTLRPPITDVIAAEPKQTKTNCKTPTSKSAVAESEFDDLKKTAHMLMSPTALSRMTKSPSIKLNCLCSPTTHIGSFRCRRHRSTAISRGGSVGSNLSDLAQKSGAMDD
ncbi:unnamed protein product [Citrullus colocynthis]|uniref:Uncharacterized protein n=1 Tax=Citrullus colocynthis TaxID=252529 RepID=A0ABP0YMH3_9ROSI